MEGSMAWMLSQMFNEILKLLLQESQPVEMGAVLVKARCRVCEQDSRSAYLQPSFIGVIYDRPGESHLEDCCYCVLLVHGVGWTQQEMTTGDEGHSLWCVGHTRTCGESAFPGPAVPGAVHLAATVSSSRDGWDPDREIMSFSQLLVLCRKLGPCFFPACLKKKKHFCSFIKHYHWPHSFPECFYEWLGGYEEKPHCVGKSSNCWHGVLWWSRILFVDSKFVPSSYRINQSHAA